MLTLENVSFSYPGRGAALRGASFSLSSGTTLLVGPNAGGKTTLLRLLAGLYERDSGDILFTETKEAASASDLRKVSRMVMQDADSQILGATVREDIELGRSASGLGGDFGASAERIAGVFGMSGLWDEPVESLSYGQRRKLGLVHALLAGPGMLLLDEPFAGLDYPSALELRGIIRRNASAGLVQVISTHELEPVFDLADWMVVLGGGEVVGVGEPEALREDLGRWSVRGPGCGWE